MKTTTTWFEEYAVSHQNEQNIKIHFVCVPAIFFSIVGILMSIPSGFLKNNLAFLNPYFSNWAAIFLVFALFFYAKLSFKIFAQMLVFSVFCLVGNYYLSTVVNLLLISILIFAIAWIGQFYGHKIEGKKPSFLKDLQFLLIGPAWVVYKVFR